MNKRIAVTIPCYNESRTIKKVIDDFQRQLPDAVIYVIDNNSSDHSDKLARECGATVVYEKRQGKGFVVSTIMRKIDADIYIMVDGDDTYPAENVHELIQPLLLEKADMVVGRRLESFDENAFRPMHLLGNKMVCWLINSIFHAKLSDPMSGYRAFTRAVAVELPLVATGFDIETEMTMQMLYHHLVIQEVDIHYRERKKDNPSKLNTFRDGSKVLKKIFKLLMTYKPLQFFGILAIISLITGIFIGYFPIVEYIQYKYVYSVPKAILAASLVTISTLCFSIGLILSSINLRLLEISSLLQNLHNRDQQNFYNTKE